MACPLICIDRQCLCSSYFTPKSRSVHFELIVCGIWPDISTACCAAVVVQGELVFKAISYTPWPVADDFEGERVLIPIGPVKDKRPRCGPFDWRPDLNRHKIIVASFAYGHQMQTWWCVKST